MPSLLRAVFAWVRAEPGAHLELSAGSSPRLVSRRGATLITVPSEVSDIPAHEILELLMMGAASVSLTTTPEASPHLARLVGDLEAVGKPLVTFTSTPEHKPAAVIDSEVVPHSRRDMFGFGRLAEQMPLPDETLFPEQRHAVAMDWLTGGDTTALAERSGTGVLLDASGCVACGVCVQTCPTQALELTSLETSSTTQISTLSERLNACIGCLDCVALCPHSVLEVVRSTTWPESLADENTPAQPLMTIPTRSCSKCRTRFPVREGSDLCGTCRAQRDNPFGVRWPEGVPKPPGLTF